MKKKDSNINMIDKTRKKCIECNICTHNCDFLSKYNINLKDFTSREDLRLSCFLCDKCYELCPVDLSGKDIAIELRKEYPSNTKKVEFMKNRYKFRNNSKKESNYLLFLGCNYPGTYPKTCQKLIDICTKMGIDYSVDCCKKPVQEQGANADFAYLENLFKEKNTDTLICTCPNCYYLLKENLSINVISVYEFLHIHNLGKKIEGQIPIFFPCSDRIYREMFKYISYYIESFTSPFDKVNCCGLGGGAMKNEMDLIEDKKKRMHELWDGAIYTYCASCSGIFRKYGLQNIMNILSEILEVHEEPSNSYAINVLKYKFKGRK
ncbi:(Fe-S)-binding protein [Peptostreptococcus equinus]|uniref:(Fe-S)-binding protein n=1 Tax=Peptostreptococcus equinus TaxID=3003601 RepID=A0ABY7JVR1_9FIRM|nr:(Fe-S)-binding protein [Peptostreptococcus sp. CBA3647]WAW15802.1 (Fe-S)-binding protein [Peptostreptococcus sp. CBA3647]